MIIFMTKLMTCITRQTFLVISSSLLSRISRELFCSVLRTLYYFLFSLDTSWTVGTVVDDVKLSLSVSKLQLKVRNGSLLKIVVLLCETLTLIFRTVAFQHFILVQSRYLFSFQLFIVSVLLALIVLIFFDFLSSFPRGYFRQSE